MLGEISSDACNTSDAAMQEDERGPSQRVLTWPYSRVYLRSHITVNKTMKTEDSDYSRLDGIGRLWSLVSGEGMVSGGSCSNTGDDSVRSPVINLASTFLIHVTERAALLNGIFRRLNESQSLLSNESSDRAHKRRRRSSEKSDVARPQDNNTSSTKVLTTVAVTVTRHLMELLMRFLATPASTTFSILSAKNHEMETDQSRGLVWLSHGVDRDIYVVRIIVHYRFLFEKCRSSGDNRDTGTTSSADTTCRLENATERMIFYLRSHDVLAALRQRVALCISAAAGIGTSTFGTVQPDTKAASRALCTIARSLAFSAATSNGQAFTSDGEGRSDLIDGVPSKALKTTKNISGDLFTLHELGITDKDILSCTCPLKDPQKDSSSGGKREHNSEMNIISGQMEGNEHSCKYSAPATLKDKTRNFQTEEYESWTVANSELSWRILQSAHASFLRGKSASRGLANDTTNSFSDQTFIKFGALQREYARCLFSPRQEWFRTWSGLLIANSSKFTGILFRTIDNAFRIQYVVFLILFHL